MLEPIHHTLLMRLLAYWQGKRGRRAMPSRADIDPNEIRDLLPHLLLTDVVNEQGRTRFRYRLVGTAVQEAFGREMIGQYIDELMSGTYRDFIVGLYQDLVERKKPIYSESIYGSSDPRNKLWTERLMLPLSTDGKHVNMVLSAQVFRHGSPLKTLTVRLAQETAEEIQHLARMLD
jgi:hypothetical protein